MLNICNFCISDTKALDIYFSSMEEYLIGYRNSCPDYFKSNAKQIDLTKGHL